MSIRYRPLALVAALLPFGHASAQVFSIAPSPNNAPGDSATFNILRGVGAVSATDAWAVGDWFDPPTAPYQSGQTRTLAMHWDGGSWTIVPTPNPAEGGNGLWDVEAIATDLAWAAGHKGGNGARPLMLRWNGSAWSEFPLPPLGSGPFSGTGVLLDMHATSGSDIWTVGTAGNWGIENPGYASFVPLAFHFDGSNWTVSVPPFVTDFRHELNAVHASAPDNVWAVGSWGETYGRFRPLVYRFDGQQWHAMPAPFSQNPFMPLHSVAVLSPDDVWVTADRFDGAAGPVTAHWDGTSWTEFYNPGGTGALIAVATDDIFGFGSNVTRWDGTSWTVFDALPGIPGASLHASELTSNGDMWAVGRYIPADELQTLTVRAEGLRSGVPTDTPPAMPDGETFVLSTPSPHPVSDHAAVALRVDRAQDISITIHDALGRELARVHEGPLTARDHVFEVDASSLRPGLYVIRAAGEGDVSTTRMVVAR